MQYNISDGEAQYMDANQGHFSKSLAEWAINMMRVRNASGELVKINSLPLDEVEQIFKDNKVEVKEESIYDAWYLYNMCLADYRKSLKNVEQITTFVDETINDPDCKPQAVLACFRAKMDVMGKPIHWERYL